MMTIYICGDDESQHENNSIIDAEKIKARLKSLRCSVVNPAEMAFAKMNWSDTLQNRIELLKKSQVVYVLPNWKESIMARIELTVAMDLKLHTLFHPVSNKEIREILTSLNN
jgi:hypothetical protein